MNNMFKCFMFCLTVVITGFSKEITWQQLSALYNGESFHSKDGLFQLFSLLAESGEYEDFVIEGSAIEEMSDEVETLFPLSDAQRIEFHDSKLSIVMNEPKKVYIPGTYFQASLLFSEVIRFAVSLDNEQEDPSVTRVSFRIDEGFVNLHVTALGSMVSGLSEIEGEELSYDISSENRWSRLHLHRKCRISSEDVAISEQLSSDSQQREIDVSVSPYLDEYYGPEFVVLDNSFTVLGESTITLEQSPAVHTNDGVFSDQSTWEYLYDFLGILKNASPREFSETIVFNVSASYAMEEKQSSISMGFVQIPE